MTRTLQPSVILFGALLILALFLVPLQAHATIAKTGADTSGTGNLLTLSFNHTLVSGSNRLVSYGAIILGFWNPTHSSGERLEYNGNIIYRVIKI